MEIIDLEWEGPFPITWDRDTNRYSITLIPGDLVNKGGIYQIYGRHPVYGANVLLYIDITKLFQTRITDHVKEKDGRFWFHSDLSIRLTPFDHGGNRIEVVESILIAANKPALNSLHIDSAKPESRNLLVRNLEFFGSIQAESSGDYWTQGKTN